MIDVKQCECLWKGWVILYIVGINYIYLQVKIVEFSHFDLSTFFFSQKVWTINFCEEKLFLDTYTIKKIIILYLFFYLSLLLSNY